MVGVSPVVSAAEAAIPEPPRPTTVGARRAAGAPTVRPTGGAGARPDRPPLDAAVGPLAPEVEPRVVLGWLVDALRPVAGYLVVLLGLLSLGLGWYGVSGTSVVARQIPYLASGGLLGVALVTFGGRLLLLADLRRDSGRLDRLELMVAELHTVLLERTADLAAARRGIDLELDGAETLEPAQAVEPAGPRPAELLAVRGATTYHRPGCAMLEGRRPAAVTPAAAERRGLVPCPLCEPAPLG